MKRKEIRILVRSSAFVRLTLEYHIQVMCCNPIKEICKSGESQNEGVNDALQR